MIISLNTKIRIRESSVLTILLYAAETWQTNKLQIHRLEVLQRTNQSQIRFLVAIRRLRWFGHVLRMDAGRLPKYLLEMHPRNEKRTRGRKRTTWLSCVEEDLEMVTGRVGIDFMG